MHHEPHLLPKPFQKAEAPNDLIRNLADVEQSLNLLAAELGIGDDTDKVLNMISGDHECKWSEIPEAKQVSGINYDGIMKRTEKYCVCGAVLLKAETLAAPGDPLANYRGS